MSYRIDIITSASHWPANQVDAFFNSSQWVELFANNPHTSALCVVAYSKAGEPLLLQNAIITKSLPYVPSYLASTCVVWGEPQLYDITANIMEIYELIMNALEHYARRKALLLEYRHFTSNNPFHDLFIKKHYRVLPWHNVEIELTSELELFHGISSRRQRQIKSAVKHGVKIEENPSEEQWLSFYQILRGHYKTIHRPLPSWNTFFNLLQHQEWGRCIVVLDPNNSVIGGFAFLSSNNGIAHAWYTASLDHDTRYTHLYPGVMANYAALHLALKQNHSLFDFMGAGPQNKPYGVRDFKVRFGGKLTNAFRYRKILWI